MVTILKNIKISNVKVTFNNKTEISYITLETAIRLGLLIIKNQSMALKIIIKTKSRFINYTNNIAIIIRNLVIRIWFYIINILDIKIILGFPFFRKARLSFQYPLDKENEPVLA